MRISQWPKSADNRWYLGVLCRKCRNPILFGLDRTEGKGPHELVGKLLLTCTQTECAHQDNYGQPHIKSFQKPAAAARR